MTEPGTAPQYPQVFVVDRPAEHPPGPRAAPSRHREWRYVLLYLLVVLALLGIAVEAGFIHQLYKRTQGMLNEHQFANRKGGRDPGNKPSAISNEKTQGSAREKTTTTVSNEIHPILSKRIKDNSRPAALLLGSSPAAKGDNILLWQREGGGFCRELDYSNTSLVARTSGIYFLFSKVYYVQPECALFMHTVFHLTQQYPSHPIELMKNIRYHCPERKSVERTATDSFLGGAFRLSGGDEVFVQVTNGSLIQPGVKANFFGAFMV